MTGKIIVTSEGFPNIVEALNCVSSSTGGMEFPVHEIPARWKDSLPQIEETLKSLSRKERAPESPPLPPHVKPDPYADSEFYTFCNGEYHETGAIANRDLNFARANVFLADFFEGWTYTTDTGGEVPANKTLQRRIEWLEEIKRESSVGLSSEQEHELEQLRVGLV